MAAPIPLDAPVTIATLPANSFISSLFLGCSFIIAKLVGTVTMLERSVKHEVRLSVAHHPKTDYLHFCRLTVRSN
jgi:hypothetical protein